MNHIEQNVKELLKIVPPHVTIVAVSKTHPSSAVEAAYHAGIRIFGENKVQELVSKATSVNVPAEWHMIGHLQTNKVKILLPHVSLIHSVDSLKLAKEINKEAQKLNKTIPCLLQVHIAQEETKFGFDENELFDFLENPDRNALTHLRICGLMGMATFTDNKQQIRNEFKRLKNLFDTIKRSFFQNDTYFKELSMGMTSDFEIAIEEGSTMIRVGSFIFGQRNYVNK